MKIPIFTDDPYVQVFNSEGRLSPVSASEWSFSRRQHQSRDKEVAERFKDKEHFLDYLAKKTSAKKIIALWIANYIDGHACKGLLSLGAGECHVEYHLKQKLPDLSIHATDFDPFIVDTMSLLLPELNSVTLFDVRHDDISKFRPMCDFILLVDVLYALTDQECRDFFQKAYNAGFLGIILVSSSISTPVLLLKYKATYLIRKALYNILNVKKPSLRFHGWSRDYHEYAKLAKKLYNIGRFNKMKKQTAMNILCLLRTPDADTKSK